MKRFACAAAFLLLGLALLAQPSYPVFRSVGKMKIDGKMDEPAWKATRPLSALADIRDDKSLPVPTKNTTIKMLWDDEYLYIGAYLEEDDIVAHLTQRDTIIYKENDFEVFMDPDGNGRDYFEIETSAKGAILDLIMDRPYSEGGNFFMGWDCKGMLVATSMDGTPNRPSDKDKGWGVEFAIPRRSVMWGFDSPSEHPVWRMNFSRVEYLHKEGPEENWVWAPTGKVDIHIPDKWGYVMFVDVPVDAVK